MRLVSIVEVNGYVTGALQVFCDGQWGAVCCANFNSSDALVACRQLGFTTGVATGDGGRPRFERRFAASDDPVRCLGFGCKRYMVALRCMSSYSCVVGDPAALHVPAVLTMVMHINIKWVLNCQVARKLFS